MRTHTKVAAATVAVVAFAGYYGGHASGTPARSGDATVVTTAAESGTLNCPQLEHLWEEAGGSPSAAFMAAEIATAESGGRQYATDADGNGTVDEGYWQINTVHGSLATYDALGNARAAVEISDDGANWEPWVTYQHGAEDGQC